MKQSISLRARLTLIVLLPLLGVSLLVGLWQLNTARKTAAGVFDRSLLSAALAVASDVTVSGGDALSARTQSILADTSGGRVFYHVYAPDGVIVAGYATPPVGIPSSGAEEGEPRYFEAGYLGREVSGVRLQYRTEIDGFSGVFTTTVWQDTDVRNAFVGQLVRRTSATIAVLILSVALIVWFGIRRGLRPLLDLQNAIEQRSSDDLAPIRRSVPREVQGIVQTLNRLFEQVSDSMTAQSEFISNAAHQIRNPVAAVLSLAEAVRAAPNYAEAISRSDDLLEAARETADLSQQLLTLERAASPSPAALRKPISLAEALKTWEPGFQSAAGDGVQVHLSAEDDLGEVLADPTMIREAVVNLVDNAVRHGGPGLSRIDITAARHDDAVNLTVSDDGIGIPEQQIETARQRFAQLSHAEGSGLGLPIVSAIVEAHGGNINVLSPGRGLTVVLTLPLI